jgi:hypothetical protein
MLHFLENGRVIEARRSNGWKRKEPWYFHSIRGPGGKAYRIARIVNKLVLLRTLEEAIMDLTKTMHSFYDIAIMFS